MCPSLSLFLFRPRLLFRYDEVDDDDDEVDDDDDDVDWNTSRVFKFSAVAQNSLIRRE